MPVEILRDAVARADASGTAGAPDFGPVYTKSVGGWPTSDVNIVGNRIQLYSPANSGRAGVFVNADHMNHGIFVNVASIAGTEPYFYLGVRCGAPALAGQSSQTSFPVNSIALQVYGGGQAFLYKSVGSSGSTGLTVLNGGLTLGTFDPAAEFGLVSTGDWILVFYKGYLISKTQDTSHMGNTYCGVWGANGSNQTMDTRISRIRVEKAQTSYPNISTPRMAIDRDGTTVEQYGGGVTKTLSTAEKQSIGDITGASSSSVVTTASGPIGINIYFPEPRDLFGYFIRTSGTSALTDDPGGVVAYTSTSPVGGPYTWSALAQPGNFHTEAASPTVPNFRTGSAYYPRAGVTGIIFSSNMSQAPGTFTINTLHLYGLPVVNSSVHRVGFWHPFLDTRLPGQALDMDDVIRGGTIFREFRIKNMSSVYTMNNIVLDLESLDYGSALTDEYSIKRASEGIYQPNTTIASLAPGAISEIISIRRIVSLAAPFRLDRLRVRSQIGSLT